MKKSRSLWQALDLDNMTMDIYRVSKLALKMILLTGQRPGEVCGMAWNEIDPKSFWNIPAERTKSREAQRVPHTEMALEIIEQARIYSGEGQFVFRSFHKDNEPMTARTRPFPSPCPTLARAGFRHKMDTPRSTPDLRTRLAEIGVDDVVAERVLGHKPTGPNGRL